MVNWPPLFHLHWWRREAPFFTREEQRGRRKTRNERGRGSRIPPLTKKNLLALPHEAKQSTSEHPRCNRKGEEKVAQQQQPASPFPTHHRRGRCTDLVLAQIALEGGSGGGASRVCAPIREEGGGMSSVRSSVCTGPSSWLGWGSSVASGGGAPLPSSLTDLL